MKSILMTGITSFTGSHIARAFQDAGWQVTATLTGRRADYDKNPLIKKRLEHAGVTAFIEEAPFGSEKLLSYLANAKTLGAFVNHGASIKGYRDPSFDCLASVAAATHNVEKVCVSLKNLGARFVHTGSIFEPDEGGATVGASTEAMSIYGVSKKLSWELLRFHAVRAGLGISKIIIPNPIGAFENEDRMFPIFAKMWKEGKKPRLTTPGLIRDNIPAEWLAKVYVDEAAQTATEIRVRRPSGFAMSNQRLLELFMNELKSFGGAAFSFDVESKTTTEAASRLNTEPSAELESAAATHEFFKNYLKDLKLL